MSFLLIVLCLIVLCLIVLCLIVLCLIVLCLIVLGVLTERLVDPAVAHGRPAWAASATRVRFIRPKL